MDDKTNKDIAKAWIWGNPVYNPAGRVMHAPTCPTCGEVTYSQRRCVFCNQLLKDPEREGVR